MGHPLTPLPSPHSAGTPLAPPTPLASGESLSIPNHQFCARSPRADGAGPISVVDQPQPINDRSRQIPNAARLVLVGSPYALPYIFIPFHVIGDSV